MLVVEIPGMGESKKEPSGMEEITTSKSSQDFGNLGILIRNKSFESEDSFVTYQRNLELQIRTLQREIHSLNKKVSAFEEETNRNRWGIRYSRRMAIMSNLLLGLWIFWSRFLKHVQKQKKTRLLGVVMIPPLKQNSLNKILYEGYMKAISKSWVFFLGSLLLTRTSPWKRYFGLGLTTTYSLYLAIFSNFLPWTNYFNMFSNLLYISATWTSNPTETSTLHDFISTTPVNPMSRANSSELLTGSSFSSNTKTQQDTPSKVEDLTD